MSKSVKLNPDLWRGAKEHAEKAGYSSLEEFVEHTLEKELARREEPASREEGDRRLKGLGHLD
jgi:hypothetical protein